MRLTIVVVIHSKSTDIVTAIGEGENVAILLARGKREEAESLLLGEMEVERLRDDRSEAAGEEAVREPGGVEGVGGVSGAAAVYKVRSICSERKANAVSKDR